MAARATLAKTMAEILNTPAFCAVKDWSHGVLAVALRSRRTLGVRGRGAKLDRLQSRMIVGEGLHGPLISAPRTHPMLRWLGDCRLCRGGRSRRLVIAALVSAWPCAQCRHAKVGHKPLLRCSTTEREGIAELPRAGGGSRAQPAPWSFSTPRASLRAGALAARPGTQEHQLAVIATPRRHPVIQPAPRAGCP